MTITEEQWEDLLKISTKCIMHNCETVQLIGKTIGAVATGIIVNELLEGEKK